MYLIIDAQLNFQNGPYIRKMLTMLEPHTVLFVVPTGVGKKTHLALDFLEQENFNYFGFIVIICITLRYNETYHQRKWFWADPHIILIVPGNCLYDLIEKLGNILAGSKTLFLIDDIIADENLDNLTWSYQEDTKVIRYGY